MNMPLSKVNKGISNKTADLTHTVCVKCNLTWNLLGYLPQVVRTKPSRSAVMVHDGSLAWSPLESPSELPTALSTISAAWSKQLPLRN